MAGKIGRKKILVVASDEATRLICYEALGVDGYLVDMASNASEALAALRFSQYDLVISVIAAPELEGIDFYVNAQKKHPYLKKRFLFITDGDSTDITSFLSHIQVGYLLKPLKVAGLVEAVGKAVSGGSPQEDLLYSVQRSEGRFKWNSVCLVEESPRAASFEMRTIDISRHGMKVGGGDEALVPNTEVGVSIELKDMPDLKRRAMVVWSREAGPEGSFSGLKFTEPFPISSVIMLVSGGAAQLN